MEKIFYTRCPHCGNYQKAVIRVNVLASKKKCHYCHKTFSVYNNLISEKEFNEKKINTIPQINMYSIK